MRNQNQHSGERGHKNENDLPIIFTHALSGLDTTEKLTRNICVNVEIRLNTKLNFSFEIHKVNNFRKLCRIAINKVLLYYYIIFEDSQVKEKKMAKSFWDKTVSVLFMSKNILSDFRNDIIFHVLNNFNELTI